MYVMQNTLGLYEENFSRLMALLPGLEGVDGAAVLVAESISGIEVRVLERSPYTTTICIVHSMNIDKRFVPALNMKIRIYRDARVAEVLAYQSSGRFQPLYPYPNPNMFQPYEKRRVNQFLREWLTHCLKRAYRFRAHSNGASSPGFAASDSNGCREA